MPPVVPPVVPPVAPPTPPPTTPAALTPLVPAAAGGPRVLTLQPGTRTTLRVSTPFALRRACATPCKATVELLVRTGRQLFAPGDGTRLVRATVTLKPGANTLRLSIPKAALRGLTWTRAGRAFETVKVRLRVTLPQADGRAQVLNRDGTLRRARTP